MPSDYPAWPAAPLLRAGLIGSRSFRLARDKVEQLGIYGVGAAAHITLQVAVRFGQKVYAFTVPGDDVIQALARSLGVVWTGGLGCSR